MWQTGGWWNTKQGEISPPALGNRQVWLPASVFPLKVQSWQRELTLPCAFAAGDILLFFFFKPRITRSGDLSHPGWAGTDEARPASLSQTCAAPTELLWCVCAAPPDSWFTQPGKEQETYFYTYWREWDWLTHFHQDLSLLEIPGRAGAGNHKAPNQAGASSPAARTELLCPDFTCFWHP